MFSLEDNNYEKMVETHENGMNTNMLVEPPASDPSKTITTVDDLMTL